MPGLGPGCLQPGWNPALLVPSSILLIWSHCVPVCV
jgi:hypothetical protein